MNDRMVRIYLRDHAALALAGIELARRVARSAPEMRPWLEPMLVEMCLDQDTLSEVLRRLGGAPNPAKQAAVWLAEKMGRLKLNGRFFRASPLSRLMELEALGLLSRAQECLWKAMGRIAERDARLQDIPFGELVERARTRWDACEARRLVAVDAAFEGHVDSGSRAVLG